MKKVMVFGVFDGIHDGHRALLKQAKDLDNYLIVVVAPDHIVNELKGHSPRHDLVKRCSEVDSITGVDEVLVGDKHNGTWEVVKKHQPDVIALGYDQTALRANLELHLDEFCSKPAIVVLDAYKPSELHSSLINK